MNRLIFALALCIGLAQLGSRGSAQEKIPIQEKGVPRGEEARIDHQTIFSPAEMDKMWEEFSRDKAWGVLMKEVRGKGFERQHGEKSAWGYKGVLVDPGEPRSEVTFCLFDMRRKGSKEAGTMLWAQKGNEHYKARRRSQSREEVSMSPDYR